MEVEIKAWMLDVKQAIDEIKEFLPAEKNFFLFQKDKKRKRAIKRNIEIIGEAINRIPKSNPAIPITNARKIVDTRNRISHGYDAVLDEIIIRDLDKLETETNDLLNQQ